jgi:hypothetical protein
MQTVMYHPQRIYSLLGPYLGHANFEPVADVSILFNPFFLSRNSHLAPSYYKRLTFPL